MTPIRLLPTRVLVLLLLLGLASPGLATAQDQPPDDDQDQTAEGGDADEDDDNERPRRGRDGIQPYDEVITDEAETDEGVFTVHQLDDTVFYEIPEAELGREFLWVSRIARTTQGVGYGGQSLGNRVVVWERRGDRVLLKSVSYAIVADADQPIHTGHRTTTLSGYIRSRTASPAGPALWSARALHPKACRLVCR